MGPFSGVWHSCKAVRQALRHGDGKQAIGRMANERTNRSQEVIERHFSRRLQIDMVGDGALVGAVVGIIITGYRVSLSLAERILRAMIADISGRVLPMAAWFAALAGLAYLIARLMQFEPDTRGSGIPQVDAEVMGRIDMRWSRVLGIKFVEGVLCTFSGLSLGREGPSVQLGAMAGKGVSHILKTERGEEHLLVTCGAAAGMSAAFHAPLTGVLFALEEIHREFNAPLVISAMAAAAMADFVSSNILGMEPVLHFALAGQLPHIDYAVVLLMGVVCGLLGSLHNVGMFVIQERVFGYLRTKAGDWVLLIAFLGAGVVAFTAPQFLCGGDGILNILEEDAQHITLAMVIALLLGKYVFTSICFGSGAPGGTLLPLVIMGVLVGTICGMLTVGYLRVPDVYLNHFVVLGVAGMFAASVRAPVTAVVLCFELTGTLDTLLAATAVSLTAYVTANLLKVEPFYERLLGNLLEGLPEAGDDEEHAVPKGHKVLHTHVVGVGSVAEGRPIELVPWPKNTLVVTIERAGQQVIPRGSTYLQALDELLIIMDEADETDAEAALHEICGVRAHHTRPDSQGTEGSPV